MLDTRQTALWNALGLGPQWVSREELAALAKAQQAPTAPSPKAVKSRAAVKSPAPKPKPAVSAAATPPRAPLQQEAIAKIASATWAELQELVKNCQACDLCQTRLNPVFGLGEPKRRLVLVGEAPGAEEDRQGKPFVGPSGRLLDNILEAIGLNRNQDLAILNTLKCRPPLNRDPQPTESQACRPFLERQIALLDPDLIVLMGRPAACWLFPQMQSLAQLRGQIHEVCVADRLRQVIVTYHPSYLLRRPVDKRKAWFDWSLVSQTIGN